MFLVVGLGNPGEKYKFTKHNFGFLAIDQIISDYNFSIKSKKSTFELFEGMIGESKVLIIKPLKYMNLSGSPILEVKSFYKIDLKNVIVLHDDLDLNFGRIKLKTGGGHAGHNGLKDIDSNVGKDYLRVRLGIGRPENDNYDISDYVLSKFSKNEMIEVEKINNKISDLFPLILDGEIDNFINKFYL